MRAVSESGAGMSGASALHMNIFGLNPVVVFGSDEQKRRMLPPIVAGARESLLRRHRAEHRPEHHAAEDPRAAPGRPLPGGRAEGVDLDRAGGRQDAAAGAHHAAGGGDPGLARLEPVLHRARPQPCAGARDRQDGPQVHRLERTVHRRAAHPRPGPHRRRRPRLRLHPARHEPRAGADRRRGGGPGPPGAVARRGLCQGARRLQPADRPEPGHPASAGGQLDGAGSRLVDGA